MYFITTKRMLEVCFFQHTPTFIIEPDKKTCGEEFRRPFLFEEDFLHNKHLLRSARAS